MGNPQRLFTRERRLRLQTDVNTLMRGHNGIPVENLAYLAYSRDWYSKIKNPASVLEFDTRNMVVPHQPDNCSRRQITPERWIVRPRVALFNSSAMNNIDNEIAQIGSELLTHFGDTEHAKHVSDNLVFIERALHYGQGVNSMLDMRTDILQDEKSVLPNEWTKGRLFWTWLTDPICAVGIRNAVADKESNGLILPEERTVLVQVEGLMSSLLQLFKGIVGKRNNSVIASMPSCFIGDGYGYPRTFTLDDIDYCNLMYWIILPALGARVYRQNGVDVGVTVTSLQYRDQDCNLGTELTS